MPPFFLLLLLLSQSELALCFPASPPSSSNRSSLHILFSTYSPNPWSSSRSSLWVPPANPNADNISSQLPLGFLKHYASQVPADGQVCQNETLADVLLFHACKDHHYNVHPLRVAAIAVWLLVLFYLLATTASDYFSCILEKLSDVLRISPAVSGVTLLAIGNGAPDVFSSVAAFVSSDRTGNIGFGSVLGGALFVTTVVSGTVALVTVRVYKKAGAQRISFVCFVRDALFLLASTGILTVILLDGKVHLWEAILFLLIYAVYAVSVWATEMFEHRHRGASSVLDPLIPKGSSNNSLPQWSNSQLQDHHYHLHSEEVEAELEYSLETSTYHATIAKFKEYALIIYKYCIEWPLSIPRRLTIPVVEEGRWSRPVAISCCVLGPLFVGAIYIIESDNSKEFMPVTLGISGAVGVLLGLLALFNTESSRPPQRFLWLWLLGGFVMCITWFYIVADQLVGALESLGSIFRINPAILGLTVLAWGNSIGDLVADLALACSGRDGVQIAISGCYAGPLFNTVVGLGLSLVVACSRSYPEPLFIADSDGSLFFIIGFLGAGLAWALIMMPLKSMRLSTTLGCGLVLLYCGFLVTGLCYAMGWIQH